MSLRSKYISIFLLGQLIAAVLVYCLVQNISAPTVLVLFGVATLSVLFVVDRWLLQPLKVLSREAASIASSEDTHRRLPLKGDSDIADISYSMNRMLDAIEDSRNELVTQNRLFRVILDSAPRGIALIKNRILDTPNREMLALTGYSESEWIGQDCRMLYESDSEYERIGKIAYGSLQNNGSVEMQTRWVRKNGESFPCHITVRAVDPDDSEKGFVLIAADVSKRLEAEADRKRMESHVWRSQKMHSLSLMAGSIAHNFNNLLQTVIGYQEFVQDELPADSESHHSMNVANYAARRAADLCVQMLAFVGQGERRDEEMSVLEMMWGMEKFLQDVLPPNVVMKFEMKSDTPDVICDAALIQQVIFNLMSNSIEAIGRNPGLITISTGMENYNREKLQYCRGESELAEGSYAYIQVDDNGGGIPENLIQNIFDPYFSTRFTGRGLGLSVVYGIVQSHHGGILVRNNARGASFRILLPALDQKKNHQYMETNKDKKELYKPGKVILIEENDDVQNIAEKMLQRIGFQVHACSDEVEAMMLLKTEEMDIQCVLAGYCRENRACEHLLEAFVEQNWDTPVILISDGVELDLKNFFHYAPVCGVLEKPFNLKELRETLNFVLGGEER
ncbi:MAG: ATP-binding protein, partial [Candidatus Sumerlaeia bacterium]